MALLLLPGSGWDPALPAAAPPAYRLAVIGPESHPLVIQGGGGAAKLLPGWNSSGEPFLDVPGRIAEAHPSPATPTLAVPAVPTTRTPAATPRSPTTARTTLANATITGTIRDLETGAALSGVEVDAGIVGGGCPCNGTTSTASGNFSLQMPPGVYLLVVTAARYAPNNTTVILAPGAVDRLGVVYLEEDGEIVGVVEGWDPAHEPIAKVNLTLTTRSGIGLTPPRGISTNATGTFSAEVWPVPIRVDFAKSRPLLLPVHESEYLANHTFVDVPAGKTLDLGTIYLVRATNLTLHLVDRVTGMPISSGLLTHVDTVDRLNRGGYCTSALDPQSCNTGSGPTLAAWAFPGADDAQVVAEGYEENSTPIPPVPELAPTSSINETIDVTPEGAVAVKIDVEGGNPTVGGNATANATLSVCGLTGKLVGVVPPGATAVSALPCVPNTVAGFGGTVLAYGPPMRDELELSGAAGLVPLFGNVGWANLTPDRVTRAGYLNFTPGAYIAGQVYWRNSSGAYTGKFSALATSTDLYGVGGGACSFPLNKSTPSPSCIDPANFTRIGCPTAAGAFCLAAPAGAISINISMPDPSKASVRAFNFTWAEVPRDCCVASPHVLALDQITRGHVRSINVSQLASSGGSESTGTVDGRVVAGPGEVEPTLQGVSIEWCSILTGSNCTIAGSADANGSFTVNVSAGWGELEFTAEYGYDPNSTWIDVPPNATTSAGTITLSPLATVIGRVVDPNGTGILGAGIGSCVTGVEDVVKPLPCSQFPGGTGTGGYFGGVVPSGPYPGYIYELSATASGYLGNSTWFNGTVGGLDVLPTLTLEPVSANASRVALAPRVAATLSTWLTGRVADGQTGEGLSGVYLNACTLTKSQCFALYDSTNSYGQFNDTLPLGTYYLYANSPGYVAASFFLNASLPTPLDAGLLKLTPYAWVAGRVANSPGLPYYVQNGFGPGPASVQGCQKQNGTYCGVADVLNAAGQYNVTAPPGNDSINVNGTVIGDVNNETPVRVGSSDISMNPPLAHFPELALDAMVVGLVQDGSDRASPTGPPLAPVPWPHVTCSGSAYNPSCEATGDGNGSYLIFVAPNENLTVTAIQAAYVALSANVTVPGPDQLVVAPTLNLTHYGWVESTIYNQSGARVPYATFSWSFVLARTAATYGNSLAADESGFVNATAYPVTVNVSAIAPGYGSQSTRVTVRPSHTSLTAFPGLPPYGNGTEIVRSLEVNTSQYPSNITLRDPADGAPVPQALLWIENGTHALIATIVGNGYGQFLVGVFPPAADVLIASHPGFESSTAYVPPPIAGSVSYPEINMTGFGVAAGRILSQPGNIPLAETNVTACEIYPNGGCSTVGTNGSGIFWFVGAPGTYALNLSADSEYSNYTFAALVTTDGWTWIGNLTVYRAGEVLGTVVGTPFEIPIVGANVTVCPTTGTFSPYCSLTTPTDPTGGFSIPVAPGYYYVNVTAAGYAPWVLEIEVSAAELVNLGLVGMQRLGEVLGTVEDGSTHLPIAGANLTACNSAGTVCANPATSDASGFFLITGVLPGPGVLLATASGYTPAFRPVYVVAGEAAEPGVIVLWPGGLVQQYPVQGEVVWNGSGAPVPGVTVTAVLAGGGEVAATVTAPNGSFSVTLQPGDYVLVATGPGAVPTWFDVDVANGSVSGVTVHLERMDYQIRGTVTVLGGTRGLGGVSVSAGPSGEVVSAPDGRYDLALPNGSYSITVGPSGGPLQGEVASVELGVTVNGAGTTEDVALPAVGAAVTIDVVGGARAGPIAGADVTVVGGSSLGVGERVNATTGPDGAAQLTLPAGVYVGYVNASGFPSEIVAIDVGTPAVGGTYRVDLSSSSSSLGSLVSAWWLPGAAVGLSIAVAAALYVTLRRRRARPLRVQAEVMGPTEVRHLELLAEEPLD